MPLSSVIAFTIYVCLVMHFEDVPKSEKVEDKCQEKKIVLSDPSTKILVGGILLVPMTFCKPRPCSEVEKNGQKYN